MMAELRMRVKKKRIGKNKSSDRAEMGAQHACHGQAGCAPTFLRGLFFGVGDEFFVGAFEVVDLAVAEVPDAGGYFVDYIVVVGY